MKPNFPWLEDMYFCKDPTSQSTVVFFKKKKSCGCFTVYLSTIPDKHIMRFEQTGLVSRITLALPCLSRYCLSKYPSHTCTHLWLEGAALSGTDHFIVCGGWDFVLSLDII